MNKICSKCKRLLPIENFSKDNSRKSGYRSHCQECLSNTIRERYNTDIEYNKRLRQHRINYRNRNLELECKRSRDYKKRTYIPKPKRIKKYPHHFYYIRKYIAELKKTTLKEFYTIILPRYRNKIYQRNLMKDPINKLQDNIKSSLHKTISKDMPTNRYIKMFGYTSQQLKDHLEKQFKPGMNWNNYGNWKTGQPMTWHLDHIITKTKFNLLDKNELIKCWSLNNLQPMWAVDNIRKGNK